ncbi:SIMPL domain-containing protein [Streptomyces sp. NPDC005408]|uniref:SIMPL domain-containing protein n=1 Tax=Streptomyces sp. NPDC005408 TaxID=3155341 RepID=UPI0033AD6CDC
MTESIKQPWGLSVYGAGTVKAEPEVARVKLAVDLLAPTPDEAFKKAGRAVAQLRETLRRHGIPDSVVSDSRLSLSSEYDGYNATRKFLGYRCQATYTVETPKLGELQQLIVDAVDAGANRIDEVVFDVRDKPAMRDQARRKAVAAARRKAEVYTEATGVSLGPVVHIEDVDPDTVGLRGHGAYGGGRGDADGDLAPGVVEVSASVLLGYSLGR